MAAVDPARVILKLYVAAGTSRGERAIRRLHDLVVGARPDCQLEVIDVLHDPQAPEDARILATPALVKEAPPPVRRVVGDLSDSDASAAPRPPGAVGGRAMTRPNGVRKVPTYLEGFDIMAIGGLPEGRVTLVAGTAGSGKTVFASQFLVEGIRHEDAPGVFVTFEEPAEDVRANMLAFGWDIAAWEADGKWAFVDGAFRVGEDRTPNLLYPDARRASGLWCQPIGAQV